ncbi:MAG: molybdate ABC transporter substrate-binding protein [Actinobacteria bacterium]|nr:molybdate ABC transporter substrate-binding protein [Actinomycetota bacterium]
MTSPSLRLWVVAIALAWAVPACGSPTASEQGGTVNVFAAASLTDAFRQIADEVERANPGLSVAVNVGASSALSQQIVSGAPADVFAAASPAAMATVIDAGEATAPQVFARNHLEIAVPADNPGRVDGLADFADPDRTFALCAAEVPCGAAAAAIFTAAGIRAAPDTLEQDVRAALSKVVLGEVDAALVYRTDVLAAGSKVRGIGFPEAEQAPSDYLLATLTSAPNAAGAEVFGAYVLSSEGQRILAKAGFELP